MYSWSKMTGKLEGIPALNTNTTSNKFCQEMAKKKDTICGQCYSWTMLQTFRKSCIPAWEKNSQYLSEAVHEPRYLPKAMGAVARFNGHGELINENHIRNILAICRNQPKTTFSLWTKKLELVQKWVIKEGKPENLILIYSNPFLDDIMQTVPSYFDKTFNNVTKAFEFERNCYGKCIECMMCYDVNDETKTIIEDVK